MIVTGERFTIIGEALAGPRFKSILALWLGVSVETVHAYCAGRVKVPRPARMKLAIVCHARGSALMRLAVELDPELGKVAGKPVIDMQVPGLSPLTESST